MQDYHPVTNLLHERVILVTGAGAGIGRAAAMAFAAHGASVILLGRTVAKLEQVYDAIINAGHPQPAIYPLNLQGATDKDYVDLATTISNEFGRLDGLLHNAAYLGTLTPIELYDPLQWYQVLQVNLSGPFLLTQACLPLMRRAPDASLVFTTAEVGQRGRAYWGAYAAAKAAIENLSAVLADELENTNVRVNCIDPGKVRTILRARAYPGEDPRTLPEPAAIMSNYLYLMGADSRGVTGQRLNAQPNQVSI